MIGRMESVALKSLHMYINAVKSKRTKTEYEIHVIAANVRKS